MFTARSYFHTFFLCLLSILPLIGQAQKLTVVADEWPPFSGVDLPHNGLSPHIIRAALEKAGYEVDVKILPWARIIDGTENGEFDVIGSLFYAEDLEQYISYSEPYYETDIVFIKPKGSTIEYSSLDSLKPYRIAVGDGFLYEDAFDKADYLNKVVTTTTLQCIQMVAFGRADMTLDSIDVLRYTINQDVPQLAESIEYMDKPLTSQSVYMGLSKKLHSHDEVLARFNQALADLKLNGTYQKIIALHTQNK